jgi:hypothetical protein
MRDLGLLFSYAKMPHTQQLFLSEIYLRATKKLYRHLVGIYVSEGFFEEERDSFELLLSKIMED